MLRHLKHLWELTRNPVAEDIDRAMEADRAARTEALRRLEPFGFQVLSSTFHRGLTFWYDGRKVELTTQEANRLACILEAKGNSPRTRERS